MISLKIQITKRVEKVELFDIGLEYILLTLALQDLYLNAMSKTEKILPYLLAFLMPGLGYISTYPFLGDWLGYDPASFILRYLITAGFLFSLWHFNRIVLVYKEKIVGNNFNNIIYYLIANTLLICIYLLIDQYLIPGIISLNANLGFVPTLLRLGIASLIFIMIQNVLVTMKKSESLKIQNLSLQSESLKAQLEMFKQQINPHFLFNSLNTLIDLIEEDSERAVEFVRHFSNLYRYVLTSSKRDLVTLEEELSVLKAYWNLLKMRFEDGVDLQMDIKPEYYKSQVPPLSLQLLIENAVKHNEVSENNPLKIKIYAQNNELKITNNLIPKSYEKNSVGVGLKNLEQRFEFLIRKPIKYGIVEQEFKVVLPLKTKE